MQVSNSSDEASCPRGLGVSIASITRFFLGMLLSISRISKFSWTPDSTTTNPPVASAEEARRDDRLVVYAQGNIHSGEVCGKEALMILARELASTPDHPLLEDLIVLLAPNLNADGNDRMNPNNRRGQVGPEEGMGTRPNAQGLNINRDWIKLDTLAGRAAVQCMVQWEPVIFMDLHTTNGSRHGYVLTYDGQRHPACDDELRKLTRYELLPAVTEKM